jgi:glycosyltransferase involved in cell wall biosynthesis
LPKRAEGDDATASRTSLRIALVSLYEAYPPTSGAAIVTYELARHLGGEVLLLQLGEQPQIHRPDDGLEVETLGGNSGSRLGKLLAVARSAAILCERLQEFRPEVVILEGASWAVYMAYVARAIRREMPDVPLVYHSHNVEYLLRSARNGRTVAALTHFAEKYLVTSCDEAFAVSDSDQQAFERLYRRSVGLLRNGVVFEEFERVPQDHVANAKSNWGIGEEAILFMGLYAYPPNRKAVDFLLHKVMPLVLSVRPEAQLVVTGGVVPFSAPWFINPGVLKRPELAAVVRSCRASACPIFSGSGTRLKILEAVAARVPVVSTAKGAEGLSFVESDHYLPAETPEQFAGQLLRLLTDRSLSTATVGRASESARARFGWQTIGDELRERLHRLVTRNQQCR